MSDDEFWKLIESARRVWFPRWRLKRALGRSPERLAAFQNQLDAQLRRAHSYPLLAACFVVLSYVSDDVFEDFSAWLVFQGRERFENAVVDAESIADWLPRGKAERAQLEWLHMLAWDIAEADEREHELSELLDRAARPELDYEWPEDKADFERQFPRLVAVYWNQKRIDDVHGD